MVNEMCINYWIKSSFIAITLLLASCAHQPKQTQTHNLYTPQSLSTATLKTNAPQYYRVKRGDTLWRIAQTFFDTPAYWKEIWYSNPKIKNPNLIYPGDTLAIQTINGKRRLTLLNRHPSGNKQAIFSLPRKAIKPFMSKNHLFENRTVLDNSAYLLAAQDRDAISLTNEDTLYAKGDHFNSTYYDVFHPEQAIVHPMSRQNMGILGTYVGKVKIIQTANSDGVASFAPVERHGPFYPKDILIPSAQTQDDGYATRFMPQRILLNRAAFVVRSLDSLDGYISSQFSTLLLDVGQIDGIVNGAVFNIVKGLPQIATGKDGKTYRLPDKIIATAIVYKTLTNSSYALVINATDSITPGDRLMTPE